MSCVCRLEKGNTLPALSIEVDAKCSSPNCLTYRSEKCAYRLKATSGQAALTKCRKLHQIELHNHHHCHQRDAMQTTRDGTDFICAQKLEYTTQIHSLPSRPTHLPAACYDFSNTYTSSILTRSQPQRELPQITNAQPIRGRNPRVIKHGVLHWHRLRRVLSWHCPTWL